MENCLVSIVIPVYNEEKQIAKNIEIIKSILDESNIKHEFIIVNDGSKDNTWEELKAISFLYANIMLFALVGILVRKLLLVLGLRLRKVMHVLLWMLIYSTLPSLLPEMVRLWRNEGFEVVEGIKPLEEKKPLSINWVQAFFILC